MTNLFDLSGKNAVVVGGAGGLGKAMASGLLEAGAKVLLADMSEESAKKASEELSAASGTDVTYYILDASIEAEVEALLNAVVSQMGGVDILLNSQGYNKKYHGTAIPEKEWDRMFEVNVKSLMFTCKHFGKYMKDNDIHGKIINISSVRGIRANGNGGMGNMGYCSTKGAVEMLTKAFASDLGPNIQVNAIGPTVTYTPMMVGIMSDDPEERNNMAASMPAQRIGYPEDLKGPIIFLASAASDFVTGSTIYPDGGLTAVG